MKDWTDERLLLESATGQEECFAELVERHEQALYDLFKRLTLDHSTTCDLMQKTWIKAFRARGQFQGRSKFKTWLFAIALNQLRDWRRRRQADPVMLSTAVPEGASLNMAEALADPAPQALDILLTQEMKAGLLAAMDRLPEKYRQVLSLVFQNGLNAAEAARLLKTTPANIRTMSARALRKLKLEVEGNRE
jgi:RNA polymerase sigma-70 factor, ECF subfamily